MTGAKGSRRRLLAAGLIILGALLVAGICWLVYAHSYQNYEYVMPHVRVDGVDLSGMTREEAEIALDTLVAKKCYYVDLQLPDETRRIQPEQTVTETVPGAALEAAWNFGREDDSFFGSFKSYLAARLTWTDIPIDYSLTYDRDSVLSQVEQLRDDVSLPPEDCAGEIDDEHHAAVIQLGRRGRTFDPEAVTEQVCLALDGRQDALTIDYAPVSLDEAQLSGLLDSLAGEADCDPVEPTVEYDEENERSLLHVGLPGYTLNVDAARKEALAASEKDAGSISVALTVEEPESFDMERFYEWVKRDPDQNYYYKNGVLTGGTYGYDFDYNAAIKALNAAGYGDTVEIPLEVTAPYIDYDTAYAALFRDRIASSDTYHTADSNRTTNLRLACQALNGTIINPGETFSFNGTVGERTTAKGYRTGIVYVDGDQEPQVGGGICQVASGCYQVALKAGMEIVERSEHMFPVTYCAGGLDATIYWGSLDFKFKNVWNMPVRLNASVSGGQVHISIDGSNFTGHYITLSSQRVSASAGHTAYRAYQTIHNPDGSVYQTIDLGVSTYKNH